LHLRRSGEGKSGARQAWEWYSGERGVLNEAAARAVEASGDRPD